MQRFHILLVVLVACFAATMLAQAPATAPKPNPELKKLAVLVGHWTYEGEYKPGLIGPGGKITGEYTGEMILGGFFLKAQETEKGAMGESRFLEIDGYDPVNKNLTFTGFQDDGSTYSGVLTVNGNTVTWTGKYTVAGKQYLFKEPFILAPDLMSGTVTSEVSVDGHTWTLFFESKWTKVKPAVKK